MCAAHSVVGPAYKGARWLTAKLIIFNLARITPTTFSHRDNASVHVVLLRRVRVASEEVQSSRDRDAIYGYLTAVFTLVAWWSAEGQRSTELAGLYGYNGWKCLIGGPVRRHPSVHRRPGQGRQTNAEQVVAADALHSRVQVGIRATGQIHSPEGRH
jgi:hypothetical protein